MAEITYGPPNVDANGLHMHDSRLGFVDVQPAGPLRDENDTPMSPNVQVTFHDTDPPQTIELENTSWATVPGNGQWLYDPSIAVHMVYAAKRNLKTGL